MKCIICKHDNAPLKKTCEECGGVLSGTTINNVTGQQGFRNLDGSFTPGMKYAPEQIEKVGLARVECYDEVGTFLGTIRPSREYPISPDQE